MSSPHLSPVSHRESDRLSADSRCRGAKVHLSVHRASTARSCHRPSLAAERPVTYAGDAVGPRASVC